MPSKTVKLPKEKKYLTKEDAFMRLDHTLVRYNGEPYLALVESLNRVALHSINGSATAKYTNANSPLLDPTAVEIGYINLTPTVVYFLTRAPYRKQKQGTCVSNTLMYRLGETKPKTPETSSLFSLAVYKAVKGIYPSYASATEILSKSSKIHEIAISNKIALRKSADNPIYIFFEQELIGTVDESTLDAKLHDSFKDSVITMTLANLSIGVY